MPWSQHLPRDAAAIILSRNSALSKKVWSRETPWAAQGVRLPGLQVNFCCASPGPHCVGSVVAKARREGNYLEGCLSIGVLRGSRSRHQESEVGKEAALDLLGPPPLGLLLGNLQKHHSYSCIYIFPRISDNTPPLNYSTIVLSIKHDRHGLSLFTFPVSRTNHICAFPEGCAI